MTSSDREILMQYLEARFDKTETNLKSYVDEKFYETDKKITDLRIYVDKQNGEMRTYIDNRFEQTNALITQQDKNLMLTRAQMNYFESHLTLIQNFFFAGFAFLAFLTSFIAIKVNKSEKSESRESLSREEIINLIDSRLAGMK